MREVNRRLGTTVVIVTHNQPLALAADRVLHFREGRIARIEVNANPVPPEDVEW